MSETEKLAKELWSWYEHGLALSGARSPFLSEWKDIQHSPIVRKAWLSVARHVIRREAKLRKAKR